VRPLIWQVYQHVAHFWEERTASARAAGSGRSLRAKGTKQEAKHQLSDEKVAELEKVLRSPAFYLSLKPHPKPPPSTLHPQLSTLEPSPFTLSLGLSLRRSEASVERREGGGAGEDDRLLIALLALLALLAWLSGCVIAPAPDCLIVRLLDWSDSPLPPSSGAGGFDCVIA
jgi:hypothetical protein